MKITAKRVLLESGFVPERTVTVENGVVTAIGAAEKGDILCDTLVPGFLDQHVHGGMGADVMCAEPEKMLEWLRFLQKNGVTRVLAGVYTYPVETMRAAMVNMRETMRLQERGADGARLIGVHLEGPFISPNAIGAMDPTAVIAPTIENYKKLSEGFEDIIRLVSLAPETEGADRLIRYLKERGIPVQAGHTAASAEEGMKAFAQGVSGITHTFNASTPIHHRSPGILAEAFIHDGVYCEAICDFVHLHPTTVQLIYRCKGADRMIVVSDAVHTTGLPDGRYEAAGEVTLVINGENRTESGALAGGSFTMNREIRNLISVGIPEEDAFRMASRTPARFLGVEGGEIRIGEAAHLVCLNAENKVEHTVIGNYTSGGEE